MRQFKVYRRSKTSCVKAILCTKENSDWLYTRLVQLNGYSGLNRGDYVVVNELGYWDVYPADIFHQVFETGGDQ